MAFTLKLAGALAGSVLLASAALAQGYPERSDHHGRAVRRRADRPTLWAA